MNEWEALEKECDIIESSALNRIQHNYEDALRKAIADCAELLNTVRDIDSGKIKPPEKVANQGEKAIKNWRRDYIQKLTWKEQTAAKVAADLQTAGVTVPETIRGAMKSVYQKNYNVASTNLGKEAENLGLQYNFHQIDENQLDIIMRNNEGVFSMIAYRNFERPSAVMRKLQDEFFQATVLGEDRRQIIKRIQNVTGYEYKRAKRIAQTERTRVQSQARYQAGQDAADSGVKIENEWSCAMMDTSRDTHKDLNGQRVEQGKWFHLSDGDKLRFPGDPVGRACNIINCYCVMIPHVLLPNKRVNENDKAEEDLYVIDSSDKVKDITEARMYFADKYGITLDETLDDLIFDDGGVKDGIIGIESVMNEYPSLKQYIKKISTDTTGYMSSSFTNIYYNPSDLKNMHIIDRMKNDWHSVHDGKTNIPTGRHEAYHALDFMMSMWYDKRRGGYGYENPNDFSKTITRKAVQNVKKMKGFEKHTAATLRAMISPYAVDGSTAEFYAEAMSQVAVKGDKASVIALEIKRLTDLWYDDFGGER